jgi:RNA polymerase sigma-70 factor (ECF subfamily)
MDQATFNERLSRITTVWSKVLQAHDGEGDAATSAQALLLHRYGGAVFRYLLGAVRDADLAEDLAQEFALRFLRGDFRRANPEQGRFRDYLKTALIHLVTDHYRARQASPRQMSPEAQDPPAPAVAAQDTDRDFLAGWRQELLERTWKALAEDNPAYHAVLCFRIESPDATSATAAAWLSAQLGRSLTADWVRKTVQRAHGKYADLLIEEVAQSLGTTAPEALRQELQELDLLRYCRSALARRNARSSRPRQRNSQQVQDPSEA